MKEQTIPTMFQVDNTVISTDVIEKMFCCDMGKCNGYCCVHGESGAPLNDAEVEILRELYPSIRPFLRKEGIRAINRQGTSGVDRDNEKVTPLIEGEECAYAVFEQGIARCGIEKAFEQGAIPFIKPLSCHLYPVRIKQYPDYDAVNYDQWSICEPARILGEKLKMPVYRFVKTAMIRKYGREYYSRLEIIRQEFVHR